MHWKNREIFQSEVLNRNKYVSTYASMYVRIMYICMCGYQTRFLSFDNLSNYMAKYTHRMILKNPDSWNILESLQISMHTLKKGKSTSSMGFISSNMTCRYDLHQREQRLH